MFCLFFCIYFFHCFCLQNKLYGSKKGTNEKRNKRSLFCFYLIYSTHHLTIYTFIYIFLVDSSKFLLRFFNLANNRQRSSKVGRWCQQLKAKRCLIKAVFFWLPVFGCCCCFLLFFYLLNEMSYRKVWLSVTMHTRNLSESKFFDIKCDYANPLSSQMLIHIWKDLNLSVTFFLYYFICFSQFTESMLEHSL